MTEDIDEAKPKIWVARTGWWRLGVGLGVVLGAVLAAAVAGFVLWMIVDGISDPLPV
ncbi:hypothetical protein [Kocuria massiliensis]|uniref:hypothetical protein n=1 Tax=Kocuria massiliensis TaxID=1926282 RepID=UPI001301E102|nr:hypothetical protein [Kocuria massiliensis]